LSSSTNLPDVTGNVIWLIPSELHVSFYREEIQKLSDRFDTARFSPHLTIGRLPDDYSDRHLFRNLSAGLTTSTKQIAATDDGAECRSFPYQNLIHSLKSGRELDQFQTYLNRLVPGYLPKEEYHISLMYGVTDCKRLNNVIADLSKRLPKKVQFSKISVIELNGRPDAWRTLGELQF
jgi:hypothetical protein